MKIINSVVIACLFFVCSGHAHSMVSDESCSSIHSNSQPDVDVPIQVQEKLFYNSGFDSATELKQFVDELKMDIDRNCKIGVAAKIRYPILINPNNNNQLKIMSEKYFLKNYDEIINQRVKDAVEHQDFNKIKGNSYGVMLGRGVIWIGSTKLHEKDDYETKIIGINNQ